MENQGILLNVTLKNHLEASNTTRLIADFLKFTSFFFLCLMGRVCQYYYAFITSKSTASPCFMHCVLINNSWN